MTLDVFHPTGGCELIVRQEIEGEEVHHYFCENKPTHTAVFTNGHMKKCCEEHAAIWLDGGFLVDLVPL